MSSRPSNGRIRPTHSLSSALAVGIAIGAFAFIIFMIAGGAT